MKRTALGLALGLSLYGNNKVAWTPAQWFLASEQGIWLDPSDMSTLFQDSAGTTPVTAVEQPVGKILDKSGRGNHATPPTTAQKPVLSARKNLLLATTTLATQNVTTVATPYTLSHTGTGTITLSGTSTAGPLVGAGTLTFTPTAGTLTMTVSGTVSNAQLEYGSTATTYQRVTTNTDYDTVGFPHYLKFDGVDDFLVTGNIDFTSTDKVTVAGGFNWLGNPSAYVFELSENGNTSNGAFGLYVGLYKASGWNSYSRGSLVLSDGMAAGSAATAPTGASVVAMSHDISGDLSSIRVNGIEGTSGVADKGTGNFGNYPLYIGRRAGTTGPFNGHLYQLVVRGAATADLTPGESFTATKTGVTL